MTIYKVTTERIYTLANIDLIYDRHANKDTIMSMLKENGYYYLYDESSDGVIAYIDVYNTKKGFNHLQFPSIDEMRKVCLNMMRDEKLDNLLD